VLATLPATAQPVAAPLGCYARTYDAAHLAAHPDQVVAVLRIGFHPGVPEDGLNAPPGSIVAGLDVTFADQGHVTRETAPDEGFPQGFGGAQMYNSFVCLKGSALCGSPCWGGFEITAATGDSLTIRTDDLMVGQGQDCGGYTNLTEFPGVTVSYSLARAPDAICLEE
jgi:hypothetical protein